VTTRLAQELLSGSAKLKADRELQRLCAIEESATIRSIRKSEWPTSVPQDVVLGCLNDYMTASAWSEPPVCAVCSCYDRDVVCLSLSDDLAPYHFELLRVPEDVMRRECTSGSNLSRFTFGNAKIDGLMLATEGVVFHMLAAVSLRACSTCLSSLSKNKIPQLALANNLYRGGLPVEFQDLMWVEEKICAIYSITAHVTRLFQSSDPAQPKVFHGNTCAHDMNVVSTVSVLPCTIPDINGFISVVFIGPEKFDPKRLATLFRVRKQKIWSFLTWLTQHNDLYAEITLDQTIMDSYPVDGPLPGLCDGVVQDHELDAHTVFDIETAGFTPHPAQLLKEKSDYADHVPIMLEKMGVSDPESDKVSGRHFIASALQNLRPQPAEDVRPDLIVHRGPDAVPDYHNFRLFPGLYPTLYPYGIGGFEDPSRPTALSFEHQAKYYLCISDRSFRYHYSFIFVVLNILQRRQAHLHTSFTVKKANFNSVARQLTSVSPQVLKHLAVQLERESNLSNLSTEEQNALKLLRQVNTLSARIPGSQASKIFIQNEIRNYYGYFGLPHIFFTFNPSAAHSPIFQVMCGDTTVDLSDRLPCIPEGRLRAIRLAQDPVAAAEFFQFSFECLFCYLFGWDFKKGQSTMQGGILGHIRAFYGMTEFTERGGLHGHFLLWLVGGLNPSQLHDRLRGDDQYQKQFFSFFEDVIHHHLPDVEDHIDPTFEPRTQRPPQPPSVKSPPDALSSWGHVFATEVKRCGEALQQHKCRAVCHKYGNDDRCRFLFPHEVIETSHFDEDTNSVVLMCRDSMVNFFNPYVLVFCRHNHDIKCILSGKGAKAAMFYVSDYITKMDVKTYEMLSLLSRAVAGIPVNDTGTSVSENAKRLLHKCLTQFSRQQQIHAQQAVRYILGFSDGVSSHDTVPMLSSLLLAYVKEHCITLRDGTAAADDVYVEDDDSEGVQMQITTDKDGSLVEANQIQHYILRGNSLKDMSYYDFCRCVRIERRTISAKIKNVHDPRVFRRHELKLEHPFFETHELVEHTNTECGHNRSELVPCVVGMSIPRSSNKKMWALFALAHFKPFGVDVPLLHPGEELLAACDKYPFSLRAREIMVNWEAVHECEDERDTERLRKRAQLSAELKVLTSSMALNIEDDEIDFTLPSNSSR